MSRFNLNEYPLWTALITPMTEQGQVDYASLKALVAQQQQAQNGILLLGSTGEGLALSTQEHQNIVEFVVGLEPQVPLMVAVGGFDLAHQVSWIERCNALQIDAYLLASPMYARPGKNGQIQWFSELLGAATKPCMIYNVPSRTGLNLDVEALGALTEYDNFWAMKEASGDLARFAQYSEACPHVAMYSGDDGLFPQHAQLNAKGLVSVCSNAWPQATHDYVAYHLTNLDAPIEQRWSYALDRLGVAANPIPVKVLMHQLETIGTPILRSPLTHLEVDSDVSLVDADQSIQSWMADLAAAGQSVNHSFTTQESLQ